MDTDMDFQAERAAFDAKADRFMIVVQQALANAKKPSLIDKMVAGVTMTLLAGPKLSLNDAWKGIDAAFAVTQALAARATSYNEIHFYNGILEVLTDELTNVVAAD